MPNVDAANVNDTQGVHERVDLNEPILKKAEMPTHEEAFTRQKVIKLENQ